MEVLVSMFPGAPIYTLLYEQALADSQFQGVDIRTSIIQRLPGGVKHYQWYLPFMPMAVEFYDLRDFDVVISDASAFAKGVITSPDTLHICYCHTPTRYLWDYTHQYLNELKYNKYFKKLISLSLSKLRLWDRAAADRVDVFVANSETVRRRIAKYYRRESTVIYPPVEVERFQVASGNGEYYLTGGRLASYKRFDLCIETFRDLPDERLLIYGDGVDMPRLRKLAANASNIEFLGRVTPEHQADLYRSAKAFLYPQEEDFGITAVESLAAGRPVIAYGRGGATEILESDVSGIFFEHQTVDDLRQAIERFKKNEFKPEVCRARAEKFSRAVFVEKMSDFIKGEYNKFRTRR